MRVPGRVRISWADASTLLIETDAGQQTRRLRFGQLATRGWRVTRRGEIEWFEEGSDAPPPAGPATWQGYSAARWDLAPDPSAVRNAVFFAGGLGTGPDGAGVVVPGKYRVAARGDDEVEERLPALRTACPTATPRA